MGNANAAAFSGSRSDDQASGGWVSPIVTRFITYQLPVARFAQAYMHAVIAHPWMQEWIGGAQAEEWVIDRFEAPPHSSGPA